MDAARISADMRLLRRRRGWSQRRLAAEARVSRWAVATVESARAGSLPLDVLQAVATALDAFVSVRVLYKGEALDRLRDERHAELVEHVVALLWALEWEVATEVSFNNYGERGSIDILAFHRATRTLLVIEVKTVVPDLGGMLATLDRKVRLAAEIAAARGWMPDAVQRLLVLPEDRTARRRVKQHEATFETAFPARNVAVNAWLRTPSGPLSGLVFLSTARTSGQRSPRQSRTRPPGSRSRTEP